MTAIAYPAAVGIFTTPRGNRCAIAYRDNTNDWNTANASMTEDEYGLRSLPPMSGLAVDIGGYLGTVGIGLAIDHPGLRVIIVEPVPDNADLIARNIADNGVADRVTLIRGALGQPGSEVHVWYRYVGTAAVEHHAFVGNSTVAYDHGGELEHETATYDALTLGAILGGIERAALLKIDCEGCEWAALADPAVARFDRIIGEWHPVRGHTRTELEALLGPTHDLVIDGPDGGPGEFRATRR